MALSLFCVVLAVGAVISDVAIAVVANPDVPAGWQQHVFTYPTCPDDGSESLGLHSTGGDPPPLVDTPLRFTYSKPAWLDDPQAMMRFGPAARDSSQWGVTDPIELPYTRSQSLEELIAYLMFFYGRRSGTFLELGAFAGVFLSNMYVLEEVLGWRGVNIEASPDSFELLVRNRPGQVNVRAAICNQSQPLHFLERRNSMVGGNGAVSGIVEFMAPSFLEVYHRDPRNDAEFEAYPTSPVHATGLSTGQGAALHPVDLPPSSVAREILCASLTDVLSLLGMSHINFWVLDVEIYGLSISSPGLLAVIAEKGGELEVLHTVDFTKISFDVIALEADGHNPQKDSDVLELLQSQGYIWSGYMARSNWFLRREFVAMVAPQMPQTAHLQSYLWSLFRMR